MTLIVDTFAWIEFFAGSGRGRDTLARLGSGAPLVTPDLVLAELARKLSEAGYPPATLERALLSVRLLSEVVPISAQVAIQAVGSLQELQENARARRLARPALADAIVLAVARLRSSSVLTGDPHFAGIAGVEWLGPHRS